MPKLRPYKDEAGEYRWARFADNGNEIAESGEGYVNAKEMKRMAQRNFPDDPFDWSLMPDPDPLIDDGDDEEDEADL